MTIKKDAIRFIITLLTAGLVAMVSIVWEAKVGRAEFAEFKTKIEVDIATIKGDVKHILREVKK